MNSVQNRINIIVIVGIIAVLLSVVALQLSGFTSSTFTKYTGSTTIQGSYTGFYDPVTTYHKDLYKVTKFKPFNIYTDTIIPISFLAFILSVILISVGKNGVTRETIIVILSIGSFVLYDHHLQGTSFVRKISYN